MTELVPVAYVLITECFTHNSFAFYQVTAYTVSQNAHWGKTEVCMEGEPIRIQPL